MSRYNVDISRYLQTRTCAITVPSSGSCLSESAQAEDRELQSEKLSMPMGTPSTTCGDRA